MGNTISIKKIGFLDMQHIINNNQYNIINTLSIDNQNFLLKIHLMPMMKLILLTNLLILIKIYLLYYMV